MKFLSTSCYVCLAWFFFGLSLGCEEGPQPLSEEVGLPAMLTATPSVAVEGLKCVPADAAPGSVVPRRLTNVEYRNTVRDLFGVRLPENLRMPTEEETLGFDNIAGALQVTPLHTERIMVSAETVAQLVVDELDQVMPCADDAEPDICIDAFIAGYGPRIWRRPLTAIETRSLSALFHTGYTLDGGDFRAGASLMIEAMLQSPNFLYRFETGVPLNDGSGERVLTDYELASKLSYFLWRTAPDDTLFTAAEQGELATPEAIDGHVVRMLDDPRGRDAFWSFFAQWLHLDELDTLVRDDRIHPGFGHAERQTMIDQARHFIETTVWAEGGSIEALFGKTYALPTDPPQAQRVGILALPAILAVTSKPNMTSPIHRGVFVREQILCQTLPPPPADAMVVAPDPDPNLSTRELFRVHTAHAECAGCHNLIDPIGLGFEHFDELGRWRDSDNGHPIDATGLVTRSMDMDGPFDGLAELAERTATSEDLHQCFVKQLFRYAMGRGDEPEDGCALTELYQNYRDAGFDLRVLVRGLASHPSFRMRLDGGLN
ncbi:MAG: DUF1592 domain-containing protein [Myxococcota bacterium]|nr:DUF1592 domain-containing protein [Myxococcota bacterium]